VPIRIKRSAGPDWHRPLLGAIVFRCSSRGSWRLIAATSGNEIDSRLLIKWMWTLTTLLGAVAAGLTAFANLPQVLKCWRTGETGDLSTKMLLSLSAGTALWIWYGVMQGDLVIMGANGISFTLVAILSFFKMRDTLHGR
jgi:MtN3 and saliva related transmembrane protein